MERKKHHILQGPDIPDQWGTGRSLSGRKAMSAEPMALGLVFFDKILLGQDSPLLQTNKPERRLRTPAPGLMCNF